MKKPFSPTIELARRVHFSCGHRYYNPNWSEQKNKDVFGACYTPYGHGHNYILEAYIEGPIEPESGMIINLVDVDDLLKKVTQPLDHRHLNFDVDYFQHHVPTTENIAQYCFQQLSELLNEWKELKMTKLRLFENEDLWVDITP